MLTVGTVLPALFTLGAVLLLSSPTVKKKTVGKLRDSNCWPLQEVEHSPETQPENSARNPLKCI